ncbi:alpha/beta hydrolase [Clostridium transplantifaecale]|uniref:alpha/beta hydrolase n=1 Tax=Clostridium transplantifaecale TaxID=2479838 RepID=UPI000F631F3E|nr:alpha/beta fold hydrolase [Clostridium transplantifaecale]
MAYKEFEILSDNIPITLSMWIQDADEPTIIFLPGTMSHPLMYATFLNGLSERGFNVIGIHYFSHGKSPKVKTNYTMDDLLQNVYDTTTFAIENFGHNISIMGSSQGGILAAMAAGRDTRIKAVFPYNIMLTSLRETMSLTKFPAWTHRFMGFIQFMFRVGGTIFPNMKIHPDAYLDFNKVFHSEKAKNDCLNDPMLLPYYPLKFVASLFNADLSCLEDGSIKCPIVLITAKGDPLFSYDYIEKVYEQINSANKEMLVLSLNRHMIFNEDTNDTLNALEPTLHKYLYCIVPTTELKRK